MAKRRGLALVGTDDGEFMTLTFLAALELETEQDTITGTPNLEVTLHEANGDFATVPIAVNAIRAVKEAPPGLLTMRDLPPVTLS